MRKTILILTSVFVILLLPFACRKGQQGSADTSNHIRVLGTNTGVLSLSKSKTETSNASFNRSGNPVYMTGSLSIYHSDIISDSLQLLIKFISEQLTNAVILPKTPAIFTLFTREVDQCEDFDLLSGIETLELLPNKKFRHRYFSITNRMIEEIAMYNVLTDIYTSSELHFFAKESQAATCLMFDVPYIPFAKPANPVNGVAKSIVDNSGKTAEMDGKCSVCGIAEGYCKMDGMRWSCEPDCHKEKVNKVGIAEGRLSPNTKLNTDSAYYFRDGLMKNSNIGKKYISYYYKLSYFGNVYQCVDASNIVSHISLGRQLYSICNTMERGLNTDIVFSSSFKNLANSIIAQYQSRSSNLELQAVLLDIKNDLNNFTGKTRQQILAEIQ